MRKIIICLITVLLCCQSIWAAEPQVVAQSAVLIDGKTGRILWQKNAQTPLAMASTAKIMTAILVLEEGDLESSVTVSSLAAKQPEVNMDLQSGDQFRTYDLLAAMMLHSYNDAAVALAEHIGGSVEAFCEKMTEKAAQIGAKDTVFGSPNGLDSTLSEQEHHSTAEDMALIAAYALKNEKFCQIIGLESHSFSDISGKKQYTVTNTDRFLQEYEGALGVKTGYTNRAGHCFVGAAQREDMLFISAVFASGWGTKGKEAKWIDTKKLMDYGFSKFANCDVVSASEKMGEIPVENSPTRYVTAVCGQTYSAVFSQEEMEKLQIEPLLEEKLTAPVQAGMEVGKLRILLEGEVLATIPLVAENGAEKYRLFERLRQLFALWCKVPEMA